MIMAVVNHMASEHSRAYCRETQHTRGPDQVSIHHPYDADDHTDQMMIILMIINILENLTMQRLFQSTNYC